MRKQPYQALVDERHFLNLPGFHATATVVAYVEDTSQRGVTDDRYGRNPQPRLLLKISDCSEEISLEFDLSSAAERQNSFHKIDTLIGALTRFREGLAAESKNVRNRDEEIRRAEAAKKAEKAARSGDAPGARRARADDAAAAVERMLAAAPAN